MDHTKALRHVVGGTNDGFRSLSLESLQLLFALECTLPMLRTARTINTMYPYRSLNHGKPFNLLSIILIYIISTMFVHMEI